MICIIADAALNGKVTAEQVQVALSRLQGKEQQTEAVEVVSAFEVPRMTFDMVQRRLFIDPRTKPLLGLAEVGVAGSLETSGNVRQPCTSRRV